MTALPAEQSPSHQIVSQREPERCGQVMKSKGETESAYRAVDAADFSRRGASMVASPEDEGN